MNIVGKPLWARPHYIHHHPRWHSFKLVAGTDQRWLWVANARIDGRGLSVAERVREFLLREAGGR